jgi:hypothetical protein
MNLVTLQVQGRGDSVVDLIGNQLLTGLPNGITRVTLIAQNEAHQVQKSLDILVDGTAFSVHVIGGTADKVSAVEGETITITAEIPVGKKFVLWRELQ